MLLERSVYVDGMLQLLRYHCSLKQYEVHHRQTQESFLLPLVFVLIFFLIISWIYYVIKYYNLLDYNIK